MVRILPALVGAAALGAAVLRRRKRKALKNSQPRSKAVSSKRMRKTATTPKSRARGNAKAAAKR
jgi:hypothetical protein